MGFFRRFSFTIVLICVFASLVFLPGHTLAAVTINKVTVTFHGDTTTTKGFTWYTETTSSRSDVQIVQKTGAKPDFTNALNFGGRTALSTNSSVATGTGYPPNPRENVHKAEATGLKPGTTYFFRVGDAALGAWSESGTFQTAPLHGAFSFICLTDTQAKEKDEAILSSQTIAKALTTVPRAQFIVLAGDWVDTGKVETQWDWLYGNALPDNAKASFLQTTLLPAAGNHEKDTNTFMEHFDIVPAAGSPTTTGAYYSTNYRNVHFITLNNNENSAEYADFTPAQIQWLKNDVRAARAAGYDWIIVNMHKGPYTTSNHATDADIIGPNGVRTMVAPLFAELDVDLVFQGHDHIYARSKPLKAGAAVPAKKVTELLNGKSIEYTVSPEGTIYVIPNTAGAKVYYRNKTIDPNYFNLFEVANEHPAAAYGADPADPTRPVRGQIQNFMGITIEGAKLTAVTYEIDQSKNNAQPYIVDQFGIMKKKSSLRR